MPKVRAGITTSVDGYVTGPNDGPGQGLGEGGEQLHYWVFGGPWQYRDETRGEMSATDKEFFDSVTRDVGAVIAGRRTYEAAEAWGGTNPWPAPFFILTHRPEDEPAGGGFQFVNGFDEAMRRARAAAGERDVHVMGGADTIRQALAGGYVEELSISTSPVVLGAGKRLFEGFEKQLALQPLRVYQSPLATHVVYRVLTRA